MYRAYFWLVDIFGKFRREEGQGLVEYALILLLIALVVIGALALAGTKLGQTYLHISDSIPAP